jgi:hypothetical protein
MSHGVNRLIESRSGVWWTSDDPTRRLPGTLVRGDDRWRLDLIGSLWVDTNWVDGLSLIPPRTIYGTCLGTRYTLHSAYLRDSKGTRIHYDVPFDERDQADDQSSQLWEGFTLLRGDALPEDALFTGAMFELSGLSAWWPFTGLRGTNAATSAIDYEDPEPSVAECGDGLTVFFGTNISQSSGIRRRLFQEKVIVHVKREAGFTFTTLVDEIIKPLRGFLAIVLDQPVEYFNCRLQPLIAQPSSLEFQHATFPVYVDPDVIDHEEESNPYRRWPTFTAEDVEASTLIPKWLKLAQDNPVPLGVTEPRNQRGSLPSRVVETVNAAETLHRSLHPKPEEYLFATKVWEALKGASGLNSDERRRVRSAVKFTELTLEMRLLQLAHGLGEEFCAWFFQGQVANWALVAAHVRNALSHGLHPDHKIEQDFGVLLGILRMTQAVIRLRLLVESGLEADSPLVILISKDRHYVALVKQTVAGWERLAHQIRGKQG